MQDKPEPLAVSVDTASQMLGLSRRTIYTRINNGELPSFRVGPRRLISMQALRDFISAREAEAASA